MTEENLGELLDVQGLLNLPPQRWLIDGILPEGDYSVLWGPSGQGKSFVALDWAASIALGRPWQGVAVLQSPVIYIAAEGGAGMQKRVRALMTHYGVTEMPGLFFRVKPLYVREDVELEIFLDSLDQLDMWPGLIIIDTLSRSFGGGEENASTDMGYFIDAVTRLAEARGCTVLIVHHSNATGNRERGHTSLKCGANAQLECKAEMTKDGLLMGVRLLTSKQKDAQHAEEIYLRAHPLEDSVVLIQDTAPEREEKGKKSSAKMPDKADMMLLLQASEDGYTWNEWRLCSGVVKSTFNKRIGQLMRDGEIYKEGAKYYATPTTKDLAALGSEEE